MFNNLRGKNSIELPRNDDISDLFQMHIYLLIFLSTPLFTQIEVLYNN